MMLDSCKTTVYLASLGISFGDINQCSLNLTVVSATFDISGFTSFVFGIEFPQTIVIGFEFMASVFDLILMQKHRITVNSMMSIMKKKTGFMYTVRNYKIIRTFVYESKTILGKAPYDCS